jgi:hypothetical protein
MTDSNLTMTDHDPIQPDGTAVSQPPRSTLADRVCQMLPWVSRGKIDCVLVPLVGPEGSRTVEIDCTNSGAYIFTSFDAVAVSRRHDVDDLYAYLSEHDIDYDTEALCFVGVCYEQRDIAPTVLRLVMALHGIIWAKAMQPEANAPEPSQPEPAPSATERDKQLKRLAEGCARTILAPALHYHAGGDGLGHGLGDYEHLPRLERLILDEIAEEAVQAVSDERFERARALAAADLERWIDAACRAALDADADTSQRFLTAQVVGTIRATLPCLDVARSVVRAYRAGLRQPVETRTARLEVVR